MKPQPIQLLRLAACAALFATGAAHAQSYQFIDLGSGAASGINDSGLVVGYSNLGATLWNGTTAIGLAGGLNGDATAINNAGQIVGFTVNDNNQSAALWSGGSLTTLLGPGRSSVVACGINDAGQSVGAYWGYTTGALRWTSAGGDGFLDTAGQSVEASGINNSGVAVGMSFDPVTESTRATVWNASGYSLLPGINNADNNIGAQANAINNAGTIVGFSSSGPNAEDTIAVEWKGGSTIALGSLGGNYSSANAINERGQVIGYSTDAAGNQFATLWNGSTAVNLNAYLTAGEIQAGWVLTSARDINDEGWIVGNASNTKTGATDAFLLEVSPVPEPQAFPMLAAGIIVLGAALRARKRTHQ